MTCRRRSLDASPWRHGATAAACAAASLVACTERDNTLLTNPNQSTAPGVSRPAELAPDGAAEPVPSGPVEPPPSAAPPAPPSPVEPPPQPTAEPVPSVVPPPDDGSPIVLADSSGARAALAPFEQRCGAGGLSRSGAQALWRVPYLQRLSDTSVDILYKRRSGGASDTVEISSPEGSVVARVPTIVDPGAPDGRQRVARIEGLLPGTYYCYTVADLTERIGFRTAPAAGDDVPVRFAVFGDSGDGGIGQAAVRDRLIATPVDLILHTGDVAYTTGTLEQFEHNFFRFYEGLLKSVAIFPVAGNHEYYTDAAAPFIEVFALPENGGVAGRERWYSFDFGDVHFVGLDTEQLGPEQTEWLDRDLSDNQRRWTVVYFHRPPFSSGYHGNSSVVEEAFVPVLRRHDVPIVFAGHEHSYERTRSMGGVTYVITGGGGKLIRAVDTSDFTVKSQAVLHFVDVEVRGRSMQVRALDVTGDTFDAFELTAPD
jgi:acid phosphatase type 7